MKSNAINTLTYTGIVSLSTVSGSKKREFARLHNAGQPLLIDFLNNCLIGDFDIARRARPAKIALLYENTDTSENTTSYEDRSGFIYLLTKPEKTTNNSVRLSFIISTSLLKSASLITHIGLYPENATQADLDSPMALVKINNTFSNAIVSTLSVLAVDWELIIEPVTPNT